jgi:mycoredoxin-dependent peroxiredoxin
VPPRTGQPAPDFTLPSHTGEAVTLSALRGRAVVLNFFPLAFSDVCTAQFRQIADGGAAYTAEDAVVLAVSVDHSDTHRAFAEATGADGVTFLSDFLPRGAGTNTP